MKLTSAPKLTASMSESPLYRAMGMGYTDNLFLIGHDSSLPLNEPYGVGSMRDAIDMLEANTDSPLLRGLLEAYFAGARDIWLVAAAPIEEYEPDLAERNTAYYEQYKDRLNDTYEMLKVWDIAQIVAPLEAPFNSTVDFLGPLVNFCVESFSISGEIHLGIMGTRGLIDDDMIDAMVADGRLAVDSDGVSILGEAGKFVSIFVGDGVYNLKELPMHHTASVATGIAGELTQLPLDRGMTHYRIRNIINTVGPDLTPENINRLAEARLNPVGRNVRGRRGASFEVVSFTDNTLALDGSDYWSLVITRLVSSVSAEVRSLGMSSIGTVRLDSFKEAVAQYLNNLVTNNMIRGFDVSIESHPIERGLIMVDMILEPYAGIREVRVGVTVGPGN